MRETGGHSDEKPERRAGQRRRRGQDQREPTDLTTINAALDELYRDKPHLPRPNGLAQAVLEAWDSAGPTTLAAPHGRSDAVIRATWPIGAALGAERGHRVAAAAIRDMIGEGLAADDIPNPEGVELLALCARVADELPARPDTTEVTTRVQGLHQWVGTGDDLGVALAVGFGNGWLAGHRDATDQLVERFEAEVTNLVGAHRLTTTFLNVEITGADLVSAICTAANLAAERDQTRPAASRGIDRGLAAGRAFPQLHYLDPAGPHEPRPEPPPPAGPGRVGPAR